MKQYNKQKLQIISKFLHGPPTFSRGPSVGDRFSTPIDGIILNRGWANQLKSSFKELALDVGGEGG
jgi:hypothetical protein